MRGQGERVIAAVVATERTVGAARETVRSLLALDSRMQCEILDLDGRYVPLEGERVSSAEAEGLRLDGLRLTQDEGTALTSATALWAARVLDRGEAVLGLAAGVVLQRLPEWGSGALTVAVARTADAQDPEVSLLANEMFLLGTDAISHREELSRLATDWRTAGRWLDLFIARVPHRIVIDDAVFVSRANSGQETILGVLGGRFAREGTPVVAFDLVGVDTDRPWLFDARGAKSSGPLLSRNPRLAALVAEVTERERAGLTRPPDPRPDLEVLRQAARAAEESGASVDVPASRVDGWLLELLPPGGRAPVARYLAAIRDMRQDLAQAFPYVPGSDSARLATWALEHGVRESRYEPGLLRRAAELTLSAQPARQGSRKRRPRGINLIGYLSGALGVGASARLMDAALAAAGVPTSTFVTTMDLQSRQTVTYRQSDDALYGTSLIAVNADQVEAVSGALSDVVDKSYRIGMWYWEVESFPASRDGAFAYVDEVWAATDFVRDAIGERATVPVRTVMPPLPQRPMPEVPEVPARLGIPPDKPWFFFAFDYLSTVERKNPLGLIEAFSRAFPDANTTGALLVIKTLNADRRVSEAERVRIAAARNDIIVLDEYLEPDELTALMANCTAYVSLHRAEGLGLTVAEAMAWGRPVVVSGYSGTMQFTNSENAFLVACARTAIPEGAEPYPAGTLWGEPDLDEAAAILRRIVDDPAAAARIGAQAARDIRVLHSPEAAARAARDALDSAWSRQRAVQARRRLSLPVTAMRKIWTRWRR